MNKFSQSTLFIVHFWVGVCKIVLSVCAFDNENYRWSLRDNGKTLKKEDVILLIYHYNSDLTVNFTKVLKFNHVYKRLMTKTS